MKALSYLKEHLKIIHRGKNIFYGIQGHLYNLFESVCNSLSLYLKVTLAITFTIRDIETLKIRILS